MQITQEQYERIAKYLPTQRGNVSMSNLQLINAILYVTEVCYDFGFISANTLECFPSETPNAHRLLQFFP